MGTVNVSSSDAGVGSEANGPLNAGVKGSFDSGYGTETWQVRKGSAWPFVAPYRVVAEPSHVSVVVDDMDPYDAER